MGNVHAEEGEGQNFAADLYFRVETKVALSTAQFKVTGYVARKQISWRSLLVHGPTQGQHITLLGRSIPEWSYVLEEKRGVKTRSLPIIASPRPDLPRVMALIIAVHRKQWRAKLEVSPLNWKIKHINR